MVQHQQIVRQRQLQKGELQRSVLPFWRPAERTADHTPTRHLHKQQRRQQATAEQIVQRSIEQHPEHLRKPDLVGVQRAAEQEPYRRLGVEEQRQRPYVEHRRDGQEQCRQQPVDVIEQPQSTLQLAGQVEGQSPQLLHRQPELELWGQRFKRQQPALRALRSATPLMLQPYKQPPVRQHGPLQTDIEQQLLRVQIRVEVAGAAKGAVHPAPLQQVHYRTARHHPQVPHPRDVPHQRVGAPQMQRQERGRPRLERL